MSLTKEEAIINNNLKEYNVDLWYFLLAMKDKYLYTHWSDIFHPGKGLNTLTREEISQWVDKCNQIFKEEYCNYKH